MEKFYHIDKNKLNDALSLVEKQMVYKGNVPSEKDDIFIIDGAEETFTKILEVFESAKKFELDVPERKLDEVNNFDSHVLTELKKYYKNPFVYVYGHGTIEEESAKEIIENGLQMRIVNLLASSIQLNYTNESFEKIKNWPHHSAKYVVLIGMQDDGVLIPSLKEREIDDQNDCHYVMNRNRIIGYIDVENKKFIPSPYYEEEQTYDKEYNIMPRDKTLFVEQRGYYKIRDILYKMMYLQEEDKYNQNKFNGIKENSFISSYEIIKDNIEYIKERIKKDGITREEYDNSLPKNIEDTSINDDSTFWEDPDDCNGMFLFDDDTIQNIEEGHKHKK